MSLVLGVHDLNGTTDTNRWFINWQHYHHHSHHNDHHLHRDHNLIYHRSSIINHYQESVDDWGDSHSSQFQPYFPHKWHCSAKGLHIVDAHDDDDFWCYIPFLMIVYVDNLIILWCLMLFFLLSSTSQVMLTILNVWNKILIVSKISESVDLNNLECLIIKFDRFPFPSSTSRLMNQS